MLAARVELDAVDCPPFTGKLIGELEVGILVWGSILVCELQKKVADSYICIGRCNDSMR